MSNIKNNLKFHYGAKKSVAYLFATILLFGFLSFNVASAAASSELTTPEGNAAYRKLENLILNTPLGESALVGHSQEFGDLYLLMTQEQRDILNGLTADRLKKIEDNSAWIDKGQSLLNAMSPEGIASSVVNFLFEFVMLPITAMCLAVTGKILNFVIQYSIYGEGFQSMALAIQTVWVLIRDTCNIAFIFLLLYIAIQQVITGSFKKDMLVSIIIAAVLINFSLFVTRIVIDAGNMIATSLYNQIELTTAKPTALGGGVLESAAGGLASNVAKATTGAVTSITLSERLMSSLQIKSLWEQGFGDGTLKVGVPAILFSFIKLILMLVTIYVFIFVSALLVGRFVMLIFLMAGSPIGFMGDTIPAFGGAAAHWRKELTGQVLVAPIFMFFMLLIIKIGDVLTKISSKDNMIIFFNYFIIMYLLIEAVKITKSFSGVIGGFADKLASGASGLALGLSAGAAGFIGRKAIGGTAQARLDSPRGAQLLADSKLKGIKGLAAQAELAALNKAAKSTFDVRNAKIGKQSVGQMLGGGAVGGLNLAGDNAKGGGIYGKGTGYQGLKEKITKDTLDEAKSADKSAKEMEQKFIDMNPAVLERYKQREKEKKTELEAEREKADTKEKKAEFTQKIEKIEKNINEPNAKEVIKSHKEDFSATEEKLEDLKRKIKSGLWEGKAKEFGEAVEERDRLEKEIKNTVAEINPQIETIGKLNEMRKNIAERTRTRGFFSRLSGSENAEIATKTNKGTTEKEKEGDEKAKERAEIAKAVKEAMKEEK
ncbi:MAG: hypothetical protein WC933_01470 [Candidatus Paceibacterota bacterium]|jgi:hypothetical protein